MPDQSEIKEIREPWVKGEIIVPSNMIGNVLNLINEKRGHQTNLSYIEERAVIDFEAPMANLLTDFYDQLKSATSGYASFNYELNGYRPEDLVRVDFLVAGNRMDALSVMAHRSEADGIGREVTKKLKEVIPRQNFEVALQAAIGARIIARETIGAYRKDVTVKIHTGDRDRKAKLLEKQKRGKARMKRFGKIDIPSEALVTITGNLIDNALDAMNMQLSDMNRQRELEFGVFFEGAKHATTVFISFLFDELDCFIERDGEWVDTLGNGDVLVVVAYIWTKLADTYTDGLLLEFT